MENAITKFQFHGDELDVVRTEDGDVAVPLRRLCEVIGVDIDTQRRKLKTAPWAVTVIMTVHDESGRKQEMACLARRSIPMWAASINPKKVDPAVREKLVAYQREAADVLADHFLGPRGVRASEAPAPTVPPSFYSHAIAQIETLEESGAITPETARIRRALVLRQCSGIDLFAPLPADIAFPNVPATVPVAALGTGGAAVVPVVDTTGTKTATEIGKKFGLTAEDVGRVADEVGIRPSILEGHTTYGVRVQIHVNGIPRGQYQTRYNKAAFDLMCARLHDLAAKRAARRRARGTHAPVAEVAP